MRRDGFGTSKLGVRVAMLSVLMGAVIVGVVLTSGGGRHHDSLLVPGRTVTVDTSPVDANFRPRRGVTVVNGGAATQCGAGSDSVGDAYRCFAAHAVYDPCWTDNANPGTAAVLCQEAPWDRQVTQLTLPQGVLAPFEVPPTPIRRDFPWGVQLTTGERCIAEQGAHDNYDGRVVDYACARGAGRVLLRGMDSSGPQATFASAYYRPGAPSYTRGPTVRAAVAWYAIPDTGAARAATANVCSLTALAFAAASYEAAHHDPDGAFPVGTAHACSGQWAVFVFSQTAPPPGYTASMLFTVSRFGWQYVGGADVIRAGDFGLPVNIVNQLDRALAARTTPESIAF